MPRVPAIHEDWNKNMVYSMTTNSIVTVNDELWYYYTAGSGYNKVWSDAGWVQQGLE